jgi:calcineurin-like phosphoesterase family protein
MENRSFKNVHEMNISMIESWNSIVKEDDEVYYLGDISYKMNPTYLYHNVLLKLNGKIYLISGNHDKPKQLNKSWERFEWVKDYYTLEYTYEDVEYKLILFHYPIYTWNGIWRGSIHICGHTHKNSNDYFENHPGRIMNVSSELLDYKPISIVEVIEKMRTKIVVPPPRKIFEK